MVISVCFGFSNKDLLLANLLNRFEFFGKMTDLNVNKLDIFGHFGRCWKNSVWHVYVIVYFRCAAKLFCWEKAPSLKVLGKEGKFKLLVFKVNRLFSGLMNNCFVITNFINIFQWFSTKFMDFFKLHDPLTYSHVFLYLIKIFQMH